MSEQPPVTVLAKLSRPSPAWARRALQRQERSAHHPTYVGLLKRFAWIDTGSADAAKLYLNLECRCIVCGARADSATGAILAIREATLERHELTPKHVTADAIARAEKAKAAKERKNPAKQSNLLDCGEEYIGHKSFRVKSRVLASSLVSAWRAADEHPGRHQLGHDEAGQADDVDFRWIVPHNNGWRTTSSA